MYEFLSREKVGWELGFQMMALCMTLGLGDREIPHGDRGLGLLVSMFLLVFLNMEFQWGVLVSMMGIVMGRTG